MQKLTTNPSWNNSLIGGKGNIYIHVRCVFFTPAFMVKLHRAAESTNGRTPAGPVPGAGSTPNTVKKG